MRKLVLHAGLHKTGSTAIQVTCQVNRELLTAAGYYYPNFGDNRWANHSVPLSILFMNDPLAENHTVLREFRSTSAVKAAATRIKEQLGKELCTNKNFHVLLSGEDVSVFSHDELAKLRDFFKNIDDFQFKVIIYVRHPVTFALSNAQELVRAGIMPLNLALNSGNLQQAKQKIERFNSVFGGANVFVTSFDAAISETGDISKHFLHNLGIATHNIKFNRANDSMPLEKTLILSALIRIDKEWAYQNIKTISCKIPNEGSPLVPSQEISDHIKNHSESDINYLAKYFGIYYSKHSCEKHINLNRIILFRNIHLLRQLFRNLRKKELALEMVFDAISDDVKTHFPNLYGQIVATAYNCTLSVNFKNRLAECRKQGWVQGKFMGDLFMIEGDEFEPCNFDATSYLERRCCITRT